MSDIKLFSLKNGVTELPASAAALEVELQRLIEDNMLTFFGVDFLKTEFITSNGGRIDSIGIDENNCPVIFEYKRSLNENVINQGLFYLDWLLDHKADFKLLVMEKLSKDRSDKIDWTMKPRLICVAGDFTKYDEHAVKQINHNIDLVRYKKFGDGLLMLELMTSNTASPLKDEIKPVNAKQYKDKTFEEQLSLAEPKTKELYQNLTNYILALGDDVSENRLKVYCAFRKIKNFVCALIPSKTITLYLRLNPDHVVLEPGFTRDVRKIGHWGTGDLEVYIKSTADYEKAKPLIDRAYNEN